MLFLDFCLQKHCKKMNTKNDNKKGQKRGKKIMTNDIDHLIKKNELQNRLLKKIIMNINEDKR